MTIIRAAVRDSVLAPGQEPDRGRTVRARIAAVAAAGVLALTAVGGRAWWNTVDAAYRSGLYRPLHATAATRALGAELGLRLTIDDSSWTSQQRRWTPLIPDHGHVVHLFLVRDQDLGGFAHLQDKFNLKHAIFNHIVLGALHPAVFQLGTHALGHEDRIIYDGLVSPYQITFGAGIRSELDEDYRAARERGSVITSLLPPGTADSE